MYEVIYFSRGGKTKKIAEVIATELGVTAEEVTEKRNPAKDSLLFLGSGCYGGKPAPEVVEFISRNDLRGRSVAIFGTSVSRTGGELQLMEKLLTAKGAEIIGRFSCRGKLLFFSRNHPDESDMVNARVFAREISKA
jgi:flavodoxin